MPNLVEIGTKPLARITTHGDCPSPWTPRPWSQVRRPAGVGGLLAVPTWFDADSCSSIQEDPQAWSNMTCRCGSVDIVKRGGG